MLNFDNLMRIIMTILLIVIAILSMKDKIKTRKAINKSIIITFILAIITFFIIFIIKGYYPITATQNYEIISPLILISLIYTIFIIIKNKPRF